MRENWKDRLNMAEESGGGRNKAKVRWKGIREASDVNDGRREVERREEEGGTLSEGSRR